MTASVFDTTTDVAHHGRYAYRPIVERPDYSWPDGRRLAIYLGVNHEVFSFGDGLGATLAPSKTEPDVMNFAWRDYGNRVGHHRLARVMAKHGFPGSVSLSVAMCQHHPEIVAEANDLGWEFFSHGVYNTRYSYGMDEAQEREIIRRLMLAAEFLNTAVEKLCDHLHPAQHPKIGIVKDLASAGAFAAQGIASLVWLAALIERLV